MEASHVEKKKTTRQKSPAGQINSYHKSAVYDVEIFIFFPLVKASKGHFSFVYCSLTGPLKEPPEKLKVPLSYQPSRQNTCWQCMFLQMTDVLKPHMCSCCVATLLLWFETSPVAHVTALELAEYVSALKVSLCCNFTLVWGQKSTWLGLEKRHSLAWQTCFVARIMDWEGPTSSWIISRHKYLHVSLK